MSDGTTRTYPAIAKMMFVVAKKLNGQLDHQREVVTGEAGVEMLAAPASLRGGVGQFRFSGRHCQQFPSTVVSR